MSKPRLRYHHWKKLFLKEIESLNLTPLQKDLYLWKESELQMYFEGRGDVSIQEEIEAFKYLLKQYGEIN